MSVETVPTSFLALTACWYQQELGRSVEPALTKGETGTSSQFPATFGVCLWQFLLLPVSKHRAQEGTVATGLSRGCQVREAPHRVGAGGIKASRALI